MFFCYLFSTNKDKRVKFLKKHFEFYDLCIFFILWNFLLKNKASIWKIFHHVFPSIVFLGSTSRKVYGNITASWLSAFRFRTDSNIPVPYTNLFRSLLLVNWSVLLCLFWVCQDLLRTQITFFYCSIAQFVLRILSGNSVSAS